MNEYFLYYSESNIVCFIIFAIMYMHDLTGIDRQEKYVKYDRTLLAFMFYFISDIIWAGVLSGVIPKTPVTVLVPNITNVLLMALITYCWFCYALAVVDYPRRNDKYFKIYVALPLFLVAIFVAILFFTSPEILLDDELSLKPIYSLLQVGLPIIYILGELIFTLGKARKVDRADERKSLLYVGLFPLMVVIGGVLQVLTPSNTPIFCFSSTVLMLVFYIQAKEDQISVDPLTNLNNRAQMFRYLSQDANMRREGRETYVVMIDINDFKEINDTYGHNNGDRALVTIADALRKAVGMSNMPGFIGRFGGDEFIMIMHPVAEEDMKKLEVNIRFCVHKGCVTSKLPFTITIGIGYDKLTFGNGDNFQSCLERADAKLYEDKARIKQEQAS